MIDIRERVPLAPLTTFEIGGNAGIFVDVHSEDEIHEALAWAKGRAVRFVILAGGSNVLVPDQGIDALVIRIVGDHYSFTDGVLDAWAGTNLLGAITAMGAQGFGGWEKLAGIPGTIGGAIRGNAGAFGSEIKDFVIKTRALNSETEEIREFKNGECDFSYRHSFFKDHPEWIITAVQVRLVQGEHAEIYESIEKTIVEREKRHLQNVRAAGSFFMNPVVPTNIVKIFETEKGVASRESRVPAGWLIEKVGMKGARFGGAIASPQHPNYLVNHDNATAHDVRQLAENIKQAISAAFGITLQEEAAIFAYPQS